MLAPLVSALWWSRCTSSGCPGCLAVLNLFTPVVFVAAGFAVFVSAFPRLSGLISFSGAGPGGVSGCF